MRIYADFNGIYSSPRNPNRYAVPLDTLGTLRDLSNAGIILENGVEITIYSDSCEKEDLEGDASVYYDARFHWWVAEIDDAGYRYVPIKEAVEPSVFFCVSCRTDLQPQISESDLSLGDVCSYCGNPIHSPIAAPTDMNAG